jgi:hypothetical protein
VSIVAQASDSSGRLKLSDIKKAVSAAVNARLAAERAAKATK